MTSLAKGGGSYPVEEVLSVGTPVLCSDIPIMRDPRPNWDFIALKYYNVFEKAVEKK